MTEHRCGSTCTHASDCAVHNAPALPVGPCSCRMAYLEGDGLPLTNGEQDAIWGVIGTYRKGLGESVIRVVGRILRDRATP